MKQLKLISKIIIFTSLLACDPPATFIEPQPTCRLTPFSFTLAVRPPIRPDLISDTYSYLDQELDDLQKE